MYVQLFDFAKSTKRLSLQVHDVDIFNLWPLQGWIICYLRLTFMIIQLLYVFRSLKKKLMFTTLISHLSKFNVVRIKGVY